jgi:hypothetical protein
MARQMIFIPEICPTTFLFLFDRGKNWSMRDYSMGNPPKVYRPGDLLGTADWTADDIRNKARHIIEERVVHTDSEHWHLRTMELNNEHGIGMAGSEAAMAGARFVQVSPPLRKAAPLEDDFPVLNLDKLRALPKGFKTGDMDRILRSPDSEDWVTWNFFQILLAEHPADWWSHILSAARRRNPNLILPFDDRSLPLHELWKRVCSPSQYEAQSRARMLASGQPASIFRARNLRPVEGFSEIDIAFEHDNFVVFMEAKLGSDVSMATTYDTQRNQIVRNIDCLIETAGERTPIFWLMVRDQKPVRAYVKLMDSYKRNPALLTSALPHRSADTLNRVAHNLTILIWSDFKELVCRLGADAQTDAVKRELENRILAQ